MTDGTTTLRQVGGAFRGYRGLEYGSGIIGLSLYSESCRSGCPAGARAEYQDRQP